MPCESAADCADDNECTSDACFLDGHCENRPVFNGRFCEEGGVCQDGVCVAP